MYAQFTQWINNANVHGTRYISFHFISCNKSFVEIFHLPNSLSDFYVNFRFKHMRSESLTRCYLKIFVVCRSLHYLLVHQSGLKAAKKKTK